MKNAEIEAFLLTPLCNLITNAREFIAALQAKNDG
jgi:hypothetical protein